MLLLRGIVRSLRPQQWMKNVLVFAAPVAAGVIDEWGYLRNALLAFVAFCTLASGVYLLNDSRDVEADRLHPTKRNRPIAAGIVPVRLAVALGIALMATGLAIGFLVDTNLGITLLSYVALQVAYTFWLKRLPVYDIVAVAAGFVLRAIAGATATSVPISEWFFIVTSFGALFMVIGKREGERNLLQDDAASVRTTLGIYTANYLAYLRSVASGVVLVGYCLWSFESATNSSGEAAIWYQLSIVPFAIAILRYALLLDRGEGGEPEKLVLSDRPLMLAGVCWAAIYAYGTYVA
jgi:decaprenyl-phosphate phosphoribosyltransferase